jgi:hypothetical protein
MLYEVEVVLRGTDPPVWRKLQVPTRTTLHRFHRILQRAMGWENYHVYLFEVEGIEYGDPSPDWSVPVESSRKMTLERLVGAGITGFIYDYDMGDGWRHQITLTGTAEGEDKPGCTGGARACPPEDCGGPPGYFELLVALADPDHERHRELSAWLGRKFDPNAFDAAAIDRALKRLR